MTTIGQRLKEAREDRRLTFENVFEATRIRVQYLQALEADDLSVMPSPVQARGYLRNYAEFLDLDVAKLLEELRQANAQRPADEVIGPADAPAREEIQSPEPTPVSAEASMENTTPLIKPKPARRRKKEPQPASASSVSSEQADLRQAEQEPEAIPPEPVLPNETAEPVETVGEKTLPPGGEALAAQLPPQSELVQPATNPEPSVESGEPANVAGEALPDLNDSLWQTWLNRLTSVLAARNKRPTLVAKEAIISEIESEPSILTTESPQEPGVDGTVSIENSARIFKEIGVELRKRRELLSLHLEEVERNTHVKAHYLEALEMGAMEKLPSTVQTRGMLSNYATFLDLDVDALLLRFADALQARHRERNPQKAVRKSGQPIVANLPPMRSFIAGDLIFGVGIVILLVGFAIWGVSRVLELQGQREVQPTAPSISDILLASPNPASFTATPTLLSLEAFPGEATVTVVIPTLAADVNVQVNLVAVERTYMRVIVDGETAFEGRVVPGTAYPFEAVDQIEVLVGSGAAIRIVYNGRDLGLLGAFGQVVNNIYLSDDIVTPTGMPSPTATITLTPTRTPRPSPTSRFTATPVLSSTPVP